MSARMSDPGYSGWQAQAFVDALVDSLVDDAVSGRSDRVALEVPPRGPARAPRAWYRGFLGAATKGRPGDAREVPRLFQGGHVAPPMRRARGPAHM